MVFLYSIVFCCNRGANAHGARMYQMSPGSIPVHPADYQPVGDERCREFFRATYLAPFSFNLRPNLGPGASYRADPRDSGVYVNYNCGGEAEKYRFTIKKNSDSPTYPPPPPTTLYSMDYFINGDDCNNLELYHNLGLDPAAYQKFMDDL